MRKFKFLFILFALALCNLTCKVDAVKKVYKTKHVIIFVVDGARYSETWGDSTHQNIPFLYHTLLPQGIMLSSFRNNGYTWTSAGHDAICTGNYEPLDNGGNELPSYPTIFQYWRKANDAPAEKAWIITSKDKLYVLSNTKDLDFQTKWMPRYDCGINGPLSGYRDDSITNLHVKNTLQQYHPDMMLVNYREPDFSGHAGVWSNYIAGIRSTDHYISEVWAYLQNDPYYAGTTTIIVTNDHGRHLDSVLNGFVSHGDGCEGCRHVEFIAAGPDCKRNVISDLNYETVDIPRTVSELMGFPMPTGGGKVIREILR